MERNYVTVSLCIAANVARSVVCVHAGSWASPAKANKPIEIRFGGRPKGPRNDVLDKGCTLTQPGE